MTLSRARSQVKVYAFIKDRIINLDFKPGERLKTQDLAKRLKVSRTPVREALSRLEQEGFVQSDSGWGYFVNQMNIGQILEVFDVREILEGAAAKEAAKKADPSVIQTMRNAIKTTEADLVRGGVQEFRKSAHEFRILVATASGNTLLGKLILELHDRIRMISALHLDRREARAKEIIEENSRTLNAIEKRDGQSAQAAAVLHIRNSKASLLHLLSEGA